MTDIAELGIRIDSSPAARATKDLQTFTAVAMQADDAAQDLAASSRGRLVPGMSAAGQQSRMFAMQLSQVAQQASATGNFVQALAIQLPDMAMGFGAAGIAAGVLASVTLPLLVNMFGQSREQSDELTAALERQAEISDALTAAARRLRLEREMMLSGAQFTEEQEALNEIVSLTRERTRLMNEMAVLQYQDAEGSSLAAAAKRAELSAQRNAVEARLAALKAQLQELENQRRLTTASENARAIADAYNSLQQQIANANISGPWNAVLGAIDTAIAKVHEYAAAASMPITGSGRGATAGGPLIGSADLAAIQAGGGTIRNMPAPSFGGGGGGGGADPYNDRLSALVETLRSERDIEDEWYQENLALLNDRRAQEILGKQQHDAALVALHEEYQRRIAEIDANSHDQRIADMSGLFGALAGIAQAGGQKTAKIVATFQAIEGTVNAYGAALKALNTPGLTLAGRFAAYASVLGAGLRGVAAIRAAGGIGGGGGTGGSIAAQGITTQPQGQNIEFKVYGLERDAVYSGAFIEKIFAGLMEEGKRRGLNTQTVQFV
jgi:hypothetical protein